MSKKRKKSAVSYLEDGCIRPLQESEVEELERALGRPIDRAYLALWVSRAIGDCVRVSTQPTPRAVTLDPEASGALRDRLAAELKGIGSADEVTSWAHRVLAAKGTLVAADAEQIEAVFQQKLRKCQRDWQTP
jgi:hypothetical protein